MSELARLAGAAVDSPTAPKQLRQPDPSNEDLGIKWSPGLKRKGHRLGHYQIAGIEGRFSEAEAQSYRVAFSAIAGQRQAIADLKAQLDAPAAAPAQPEIQTLRSGRWQVVSRLLNLGQSEILLCKNANHQFAVIESFRADSVYSKANERADLLMEGGRSRQLAEDFKANARHTLAFMASNLAAKAQKILWEEFPAERPSRIAAAISEQCLRAAAGWDSVSIRREQGLAVSRGGRI